MVRGHSTLNVREIAPETPLTAPRHEPARAGEVLRSCLDVPRASTELGWRAKTTLEQGLRVTLSSTTTELPLAA